MSLSVGTRIGSYEVTAALGVGGMGEVYRARDTRLNRDVALKILPEIFAADPERLARFEREAQVLASLNHPYIAAIHGIEESDGLRALVLELVEGETLADRIARGAIPIDEAMPIARQIAEALEAAHEQGVVHRDLKPANIKVRDDGTVKVLDFGLAKLATPVGAIGAAATTSPTITSPALVTGVGMLLGTAAYMSPEQAKGREADKRSDIWAFGCVLFEMLTGRRAFAGDDVADTLANVLKTEVDWGALPAAVPEPIRAIIRSALHKERRRRLGDIAAALFVLNDLHVDTKQPLVVRARAWRTLAVVVIALMGTAIAAVAVWRLKPVAPSPVTRFTLPMDASAQLAEGAASRRMIAISPDGSRVAYVTGSGLYLRSMAERAPKQLVAGSVAQEMQIQNLAFSPDGQSIAFYSVSDQTLKRIAISGGAPVTLCTTTAPNGIDWNTQGIMFGVFRTGVMLVSADGGTPRTLVSVPGGQSFVQPQLLPDGRTVLFTLADASTALDFDKARIVAQSLDSGERRVLINGGTDGRYVPTGHIVYALGGVLFAVPFDLRRMQVTGPPVAVVEGVARGVGVVGTATAQFSVANAAGSLVYVPGPSASSASRRNLIAIDRDGTAHRLDLPLGPYLSPRVAPDGRQLAVVSDDSKDVNVWVADLAGATSMRRLTLEGKNRFPVWSPDSRRIAFQSDRDGDRGIWWQAADGSGTAERLSRAERGMSHVPETWVAPSNTLLFSAVGETDTASLWALSVQTKQIERFDTVTSNSPLDSAVSPDGRWVAYTERSSGRSTVYVQPIPATGAKYQVADRAHHPLWSRDGSELQFFPGSNRLLAVHVSMRPGFSFSIPEPVPGGFTSNTSSDSGRNHDVTPDGRIVASLSTAEVPGDASATQQIEVVLNWLEELKARVPTN